MAGITELVLSSNFLFYAVLFLAGNGVLFLLQTRRPKDFPPGPRGLPGLGNLLQINKAVPALTFGAWGQKYGQDTPLGIQMGANNIVVLNSGRLVRELFERRGAVYSDRPRPHDEDEKWKFKTEFRAALFQDSGAWLTRWRREFYGHFGSPAAISRLHPMYDAETARVLVALLMAPTARRAALEDILLNWMISVPSIGVCGQRPEAMRHVGFSVENFRRCAKDYMILTKPGLMDVFPVLQYLPGKYGIAGWKKRSRVVAKDVLECADQFFRVAKEQRAELDAGKSIGYECLLAKTLREQRDNKDDTWTDLGPSAFNIVSAAMYTSLAVFSTILVIVAKYPDVQQRIREEVLEVSGGGPLTSADVDRLKYTEAFWHEVNRWRTVGPQGFPHAPNQDDVYEGYRIPKHTAVVPNVWNIHHSTEDYDSPEKFEPERFLRHPFGMRPDEAHDPAILEASSSRITYSFGAGRRICPGIHSAKQSLLLGLAKMLWAFDILPAEGKEIDLGLETGFVQGLITFHPKELDIMFRLRPERSEQDVLDHYSQTYKVEAEFLGWENGLRK